MIKKLILFILISCLFLACSGKNYYSASETIRHQKIVEKYFPALRIPGKADMVADWADNRLLEGGFAPVFAKGDFNGDNKEDFACICVKGHKMPGTEMLGRLLLFEMQEKDDYKVVELDRYFIPHNSAAPYIRSPSSHFIKTCHQKELPPKINSPHENRIFYSRDVKAEDCLLIGSFEASEAIVYWDGNEYKWYWVSD